MAEAHRKPHVRENFAEEDLRRALAELQGCPGDKYGQYLDNQQEKIRCKLLVGLEPEHAALLGGPFSVDEPIEEKGDSNRPVRRHRQRMLIQADSFDDEESTDGSDYAIGEVYAYAMNALSHPLSGFGMPAVEEIDQVRIVNLGDLKQVDLESLGRSSSPRVSDARGHGIDFIGASACNNLHDHWLTSVTKETHLKKQSVGPLWIDHATKNASTRLHQGSSLVSWDAIASESLAAARMYGYPQRDFMLNHSGGQVCNSVAENHGAIRSGHDQGRAYHAHALPLNGLDSAASGRDAACDNSVPCQQDGQINLGTMPAFNPSERLVCSSEVDCALVSDQVVAGSADGCSREHHVMQVSGLMGSRSLGGRAEKISSDHDVQRADNAMPLSALVSPVAGVEACHQIASSGQCGDQSFHCLSHGDNPAVDTVGDALGGQAETMSGGRGLQHVLQSSATASNHWTEPSRSFADQASQGTASRGYLFVDGIASSLMQGNSTISEHVAAEPNCMKPQEYAPLNASETMVKNSVGVGKVSADQGLQPPLHSLPATAGFHANAVEAGDAHDFGSMDRGPLNKKALLSHTLNESSSGAACPHGGQTENMSNDHELRGACNGFVSGGTASNCIASPCQPGDQLANRTVSSFFTTDSIASLSVSETVASVPLAGGPQYKNPHEKGAWYEPGSRVAHSFSGEITRANRDHDLQFPLQAASSVTEFPGRSIEGDNIHHVRSPDHQFASRVSHEGSPADDTAVVSMVSTDGIASVSVSDTVASMPLAAGPEYKNPREKDAGYEPGSRIAHALSGETTRANRGHDLQFPLQAASSVVEFPGMSMEGHSMYYFRSPDHQFATPVSHEGSHADDTAVVSTDGIACLSVSEAVASMPMAGGPEYNNLREKDRGYEPGSRVAHSFSGETTRANRDHDLQFPLQAASSVVEFPGRSIEGHNINYFRALDHQFATPVSHEGSPAHDTAGGSTDGIASLSVSETVTSMPLAGGPQYKNPREKDTGYEPETTRANRDHDLQFPLQAVSSVTECSGRAIEGDHIHDFRSPDHQFATPISHEGSPADDAVGICVPANSIVSEVVATNSKSVRPSDDHATNGLRDTIGNWFGPHENQMKSDQRLPDTYLELRSAAASANTEADPVARGSFGSHEGGSKILKAHEGKLHNPEIARGAAESLLSTGVNACLNDFFAHGCTGHDIDITFNASGSSAARAIGDHARITCDREMLLQVLGFPKHGCEDRGVLIDAPSSPHFSLAATDSSQLAPNWPQPSFSCTDSSQVGAADGGNSMRNATLTGAVGSDMSPSASGMINSVGIGSAVDGLGMELAASKKDKNVSFHGDEPACNSGNNIGAVMPKDSSANLLCVNAGLTARGLRPSLARKFSECVSVGKVCPQGKYAAFYRSRSIDVVEGIHERVSNPLGSSMAHAGYSSMSTTKASFDSSEPPGPSGDRAEAYFGSSRRAKSRDGGSREGGRGRRARSSGETHPCIESPILPEKQAVGNTLTNNGKTLNTPKEPVLAKATQEAKAVSTPKSPVPPPAKTKGSGKGAPPPKMGGQAKSSPKAKPKVEEPRKPEVKPCVALKKVYWSSFRVNDAGDKTVWNEIDAEGAVIDTQELESCFKDESGAKMVAQVLSPVTRVRKTQKIQVLEDQRRRQICVMLARLPDNDTLHSALMNMDKQKLNKDQIELLLRNLPSAEEVKLMESALQAHTIDDFNVWDVAEEFLIVLIRIPQFQLRLQVWNFEESFGERIHGIGNSERELANACDSVLTSGSLRHLLGIILYTGNYLNGGTPRGRADGFTIDALNQMRTVKMTQASSDRPGSLVDYITRQMEKQYPDELEQLMEPGKEMACIKLASRRNLSDIAEELALLRKEANDLLQRMRSVQVADEHAHHDAFGEHAETLAECFAQLDQQGDRLTAVEEQYTKLSKWFHMEERSSKKTTEEFFTIWDRFLGDIVQARKSLQDQEKQEAIKRARAAFTAARVSTPQGRRRTVAVLGDEGPESTQGAGGREKKIRSSTPRRNQFLAQRSRTISVPNMDRVDSQGSGAADGYCESDVPMELKQPQSLPSMPSCLPRSSSSIS